VGRAKENVCEARDAEKRYGNMESESPLAWANLLDHRATFVTLSFDTGIWELPIVKEDPPASDNRNYEAGLAMRHAAFSLFPRFARIFRASINPMATSDKHRDILLDRHQRKEYLNIRALNMCLCPLSFQQRDESASDQLEKKERR
jgi:hypothetical protein